jgi:hypothetical protein
MATGTPRKGAYGSGTTSFLAAVPTAGNAPILGDAMYIVMESCDSATTAGTPTTPTGWTKLHEDTKGIAGSIATTLTIYGRIATASEADVTVTGVGDHCSGSMIVITDHGMKDIRQTVIGTAGGEDAAGTAGSAPAITVTAQARVIMCVASSRDVASATQFSSWAATNPASLTELEDNTVATGAGGGIGYAHGTCTGTTTGTATAVVTSAAHSDVLIGIPSFRNNLTLVGVG